jgi:energy-coupling factor transport system ATP-binding protein
MILDEPTSMLDPISRKRVFDVLSQLKKEQNNTIIVIEHSLENLVPLADRMLLFANGQLVLADETRAFFQHMDLLLENGITPPDIMLYFYRLSQEGFYDGLFPLTVEDASKRLLELFARRKVVRQAGDRP